ncbi:MAG: prolipoprotein diacylglyceryl transferase [Dehalococcoidales bacterium]
MISDFNIGPFSIHLYGLMLATGVFACLIVAFIEAKRHGEPLQHLLNMALIVIPLGVIGARLYHVIDQWNYYSQHPAEIFGFAGLGIYGAVIGGAIGVIIYTKWRKISTLRWLDIIAPGLILAQAIGRWGNFFNQELYGYPTDLPWAIYIDPAHRLPGYEAYTHFHPLFFYEFIWDLTGFIVLMIIARKLKTKLFDGDIFLSYVIYYGIGRFALEGLKIDVWTIAGFPTARWISGIAVIGSLAVIFYRHYRRKHNYSQKGPG